MSDKQETRTLEQVQAELAQVNAQLAAVNQALAAAQDRQRQIRGEQGRN